MTNKDISILVVDDIENMRKLITSMLFKLQFNRIMTAENGRDAWVKVQSHHFDLVISDYNMPKMSGLDLLKAIRSDPKFSNLPVLMITAEAEKESIVETAKHKVNGYIVKPFSPATLDAKVSDIFKKLGQ